MKRESFSKRFSYHAADALIIFLVCFIPKFIIAVNSVIINTAGDETSALSIAAFIAGYDWRDVVSNAGYYGIGWICVYFPLFKLGIPAVTIYRIILSCNAILIGLTGVICYVVLNRFFKIEGRLMKIAIACTCGCMSIFSTSITRARNEDIYLLCGWLFAYVILKLSDEALEKRRSYEVLLLGILLYMLTVHSRAVTYIIAFVLTCIVYWLLFHKKLVSVFFWIVSGVGFVAVELLLKLYQMWVWNSTSVANTSVAKTVTNSFSKITIDFTMLKSSLMIILGQFFTGFSLSGGIFLIAFVVFTIFACQCIKNRKCLSDEDIKLFLLGGLYGLMTLITICGQSITWGVSVYKGLVSDSYSYIYAYKAFTYMRYMGSYVPVFVMTALIIICNNRNLWKKVCRRWLPVTFIGLLLFWICEILPYVKETKSNMEFFISIVSLPSDTGNSVTTWNKMFLILLLMLFIWMLFDNRKAFVIKLFVIGVLFTSHERLEIFFNRIIISEESNWNSVNAGYDVIQSLHDTLLEDNADICVVDGKKTEHQMWYLYQFLNYDLHIIPGASDEITQTELVFSNVTIAEQLSDDYVCFMLDGNEYVYSRNPEYSALIGEMGYEEFAE